MVSLSEGNGMPCPRVNEAEQPTDQPAIFTIQRTSSPSTATFIRFLSFSLFLLGLESCLFVGIDKLAMLWMLLEVIILGLLDAFNFGSKGRELLLFCRSEGSTTFSVRQSSDFGLVAFLGSEVRGGGRE